MASSKPRVGRPPSCTCGGCPKCKRAAYMRAWWRRQSRAHRRRLIEGRDPERVREQDRRKQERRRRAGTPEQKLRIEARTQVRLAIARGELKRGDCEVCGEPDAHAHHVDYTKPLEVHWFCRRHHDGHHTILRDLEEAAA